MSGGQICYEAYSSALADQSNAKVPEWPLWQELGTLAKQRWEKAAQAVVKAATMSEDVRLSGTEVHIAARANKQGV